MCVHGWFGMRGRANNPCLNRPPIVLLVATSGVILLIDPWSDHIESILQRLGATGF
jgi:hypothetical protein